MSILQFNEFLIREMSMSRVWEYFGTETYPAGIMSAYRGGLSADENGHRTVALGSQVRDAGFGYVFADGTYKEHGPHGDVPVKETVLIISGTPHDSGKLKGFMKQWRADYDQDSVLYKPEGNTHAFLLSSSGEENIGTFHPNRTGEIMTRLRGHSHATFVFEEAYAAMTFMERLAHSKRVLG